MPYPLGHRGVRHTCFGGRPVCGLAPAPTKTCDDAENQKSSQLPPERFELSTPGLRDRCSNH